MFCLLPEMCTVLCVDLPNEPTHLMPLPQAEAQFLKCLPYILYYFTSKYIGELGEPEICAYLCGTMYTSKKE